MKIVIETIPHNTHRYPTVGDWFYESDGTLRIKVSELTDQRYEFLIAVHELTEAFLCSNDGVTIAAVDDFDKTFEAERKEGNEDEPGDEPLSPYVGQHCFATGIERLLAAWLDVKWKTYEEELSQLM